MAARGLLWSKLAMDELLHLPGPDESAHTTARRSARNSRVEIITRGERRRSWTQEQKREIVAESLGPDLTPTEVARKHAISSGQLYTWRQQLLRMQTALARSPPRFAEVDRAAAQPSARPIEPASLEAPPPTAPSAPARPEGLIEVVLPRGVVVRIDAHVDSRALRRVLGALEGR
jgi:transposase